MRSGKHEEKDCKVYFRLHIKEKNGQKSQLLDS